jgi:hypothetical protein
LEESTDIVLVVEDVRGDPQPTGRIASDVHRTLPEERAEALAAAHRNSNNTGALAWVLGRGAPGAILSSRH